MTEDRACDHEVVRTARLLLEAAEALLPAAALAAVIQTPIPGAPWAHISRVVPGGPVRVDLVEFADVPAEARHVLSAGRPLVEAAGRRGDDHIIAAPLRRDGRVHGALVGRRPPDGQAFGHMGCAALTALGRSHALALENALLVERLHHEASHDPLTGLLNRKGLEDRIERALHERDATHWGVATLILGLDGFRDLNASLGHHGGDVVLGHVADAVLAALPLGAEVARTAGDEFAVLLTGVLPADGAATLAHRLRAAAATSLTIQEVEVRARASVGIAVAHPELTDARSLLGTAELALAQVKRQLCGVVTQVAVNPGHRPCAAAISTLAERQAC